MTGREQGEIQPKTSRSIEIAHEHEQRHEHEAQVVNVCVMVWYVMVCTSLNQKSTYQWNHQYANTIY